MKLSLEDAVSEVRKLAKQFKERNGNTSLRIPNKDFSLWIINKLLEQDNRITRVEVKQYAFILVVTLVAAGLTILR